MKVVSGNASYGFGWEEIVNIRLEAANYFMSILLMTAFGFFHTHHISQSIYGEVIFVSPVEYVLVDPLKIWKIAQKALLKIPIAP